MWRISSVVYQYFFGISSVILQWITEEPLKKYRRNTEEKGCLYRDYTCKTSTTNGITYLPIYYIMFLR